LHSRISKNQIMVSQSLSALTFSAKQDLIYSENKKEILKKNSLNQSRYDLKKITDIQSRYICMYICIYMYIYTHMYLYVYIYT
jgi:hypothetical protein